jgi:hypothetical protein
VNGWKFCIVDPQDAALALCRGKMDEGDGYGAGSTGGNNRGCGSAYGWGLGDGWGAGIRDYTDYLGNMWVPADETRFGDPPDGDGESAGAWR